MDKPLDKHVPDINIALHKLNTGLNFILLKIVQFKSAIGKTLTAIYRLVQTWLEWNLCRLAALRANSVKHFSFFLCRAIPAVLGLSCRSAFLTSPGFILKTLFSIKFLFPCSKYKLTSTILAH